MCQQMTKKFKLVEKQLFIYFSVQNEMDVLFKEESDEFIRSNFWWQLKSIFSRGTSTRHEHAHHLQK